MQLSVERKSLFPRSLSGLALAATKIKTQPPPSSLTLLSTVSRDSMSGGTMLTRGPAKFREAIGVTIPSLIKQLGTLSLQPESMASVAIFNLSQSSGHA